MTPADIASPPLPSDKRRYVREIFSEIAPRYDLLNHLLSLNVDRSWRRKAVSRLEWERRPGGVFLDACAGTLDFAATLAGCPGFRGKVVATDFALPMLRLGRRKTSPDVVWPAGADALQLPFGNAVFDGGMVAFGVRNLADLDAGLLELFRVLRPGTRLVILDFTTPAFTPVRALYLFYFRRILPVVGRIVSGHPTAYSYLPASVMDFPSPEALERRLERAGFHDCGHIRLTGGIAAIHWGVR
ncbi:MAG: ubiquinone/menaquinone biosynthesis methyltransferase [Gemmatimonadetes bacterium]|nr:ubiquinone/menaquinone biosynthesis methyltransferase [Gemmatimonadota bacterium]